MKHANDILKSVMVTEKGTTMQESDNRYMLRVAKAANKTEIKKAVEEIFGVKVKTVNTLNVRGKEKRQGAARPGMTRSWKKAYIQLTDDSKGIEFFEGMV